MDFYEDFLPENTPRSFIIHAGKTSRSKIHHESLHNVLQRKHEEKSVGFKTENPEEGHQDYRHTAGQTDREALKTDWVAEGEGTC